MTCLLRSLGLLAVLLLAGCYAVPQGKSDLFDRLIALMAERERLWYEPKPEGTRQKDISHLVCSWVSIDKLNAMTSEVGPTRALEHSVINTRITVGFPPGTARWILRQPLRQWHLGFSQLMIDIAPDGSCVVLYQHIM